MAAVLSRGYCQAVVRRAERVDVMAAFRSRALLRHDLRQRMALGTPASSPAPGLFISNADLILPRRNLLQ